MCTPEAPGRRGRSGVAGGAPLRPAPRAEDALCTYKEICLYMFLSLYIYICIIEREREIDKEILEQIMKYVNVQGNPLMYKEVLPCRSDGFGGQAPTAACGSQRPARAWGPSPSASSLWAPHPR